MRYGLTDHTGTSMGSSSWAWPLRAARVTLPSFSRLRSSSAWRG